MNKRPSLITMLIIALSCLTAFGFGVTQLHLNTNQLAGTDALGGVSIMSGAQVTNLTSANSLTIQGTNLNIVAPTTSFPTIVLTNQTGSVNQSIQATPAGVVLGAVQIGGGTVTGSLNGNANTATYATNASFATNSSFATNAGTSTNFTGSLAGDVTGTQGATIVGSVAHVSSGTLAVANGGTGQTTTSGIASAIGAFTTNPSPNQAVYQTPDFSGGMRIIGGNTMPAGHSIFSANAQLWLFGANPAEAVPSGNSANYGMYMACANPYSRFTMNFPIVTTNQLDPEFSPLVTNTSGTVIGMGHKTPEAIAIENPLGTAFNQLGCANLVSDYPYLWLSSSTQNYAAGGIGNFIFWNEDPVNADFFGNLWVAGNPTNATRAWSFHMPTGDLTLHGTCYASSFASIATGAYANVKTLNVVSGPGNALTYEDANSNGVIFTGYVQDGSVTNFFIGNTPNYIEQTGPNVHRSYVNNSYVWTGSGWGAIGASSNLVGYGWIKTNTVNYETVNNNLTVSGSITGTVPISDLSTNGMNPAPTAGQILTVKTDGTIVASNAPSGGGSGTVTSVTADGTFATGTITTSGSFTPVTSPTFSGINITAIPQFANGNIFTQSNQWEFNLATATTTNAMNFIGTNVAINGSQGWSPYRFMGAQAFMTSGSLSALGGFRDYMKGVQGSGHINGSYNMDWVTSLLTNNIITIDNLGNITFGGGTGQVTADGFGITDLQSSQLTGALPAIDGTALTGVAKTGSANTFTAQQTMNRGVMFPTNNTFVTDTASATNGNMFWGQGTNGDAILLTSQVGLQTSNKWIFRTNGQTVFPSSITASGATFSGNISFLGWVPPSGFILSISGFLQSLTSGNSTGLTMQPNTVTSGAGSCNFFGILNTNTLNFSGAQTGTYTDYDFDDTETALNGITHYFERMRVSGGTKHSFDNAGNAIHAGTDTATNGFVSYGTNSFTNNYAKIGVVLAPSPAIALTTNWTNTYGTRIQLIVDGTLNMAVAGTVTCTLTNITTTESHVIAGSTLSIAGTTYFSYPYYMSTNDVIQVLATTTGTASATITQSTVKFSQ